jgi:Tol biopolymer transport system component
MPLSAGSPRWSPDGTWIAFDSLERGGWDVFVIRPDGTGLRKMTWHEGSDLRPSWSSDGNWLYFGSDRSGTMEIWKMPFAGGRAVQITFQGGYDAVESPDGKRIFYTRRGVPGLWTRPVDGGAHEEEKLLIKELEWQNSRNWTVRKDGIYFLACGAGGRRDRPCFLRRYRFDTGALESVLNLGELRLNDSGCSISPDGAWLYYVQRAETETDIAMVEGWR